MLLGTSLPEYYTIEEFAKLHNVTENSIVMKIQRETIDYYRLGSGKRTTVLIPRSAKLEPAKRGRKPKSKVDTEK